MLHEQQQKKNVELSFLSNLECLPACLCLSLSLSLSLYNHNLHSNIFITKAEIARLTDYTQN